MPPEEIAQAADERRQLVERVAASRHLARSERLRSLLWFLAERVIADSGAAIHEQEVGHHVFGRPADYDAAADNIVRVHVSTLRKRLDQYFAAEGAAEPLIIEVPKGNYAPLFLPRSTADSESTLRAGRAFDWRHVALAVLVLIFASATLLLWLGRERAAPPRSAAVSPAVRLFWSRVFQPNRLTDIVLDDAAIGLYQELTGRPVTLSNYFDRAYLRALPAASSAIALRRQSSFAAVSFLWKVSQVLNIGPHAAQPRFARDYSFRELKVNDVILLGNSRANPWIESFEPRLGLRWLLDPATGNYYPSDTWDAGRRYQPAGAAELHEGYCGFSLLANSARSGSILIVTATGGSAVNACADFLADEASVAAMRSRLPGPPAAFPDFEALIKVKGRGATPRDASIVLCRPVKP